MNCLQVGANVTSESGQGNAGGGSGCCRRRDTGQCMCLLHRSHHSLWRLLSGNGRSERVGIRGEWLEDGPGIDDEKGLADRFQWASIIFGMGGITKQKK